MLKYIMLYSCKQYGHYILIKIIPKIQFHLVSMTLDYIVKSMYILMNSMNAL